MNKPVLLFDVNETLMDLQALRPHFERLFGDAAVTGQWFAQLLRASMVATIVGDYQDFGVLGRDALLMTAERRGQALSDEDQDVILATMHSLPPHPDVPEGLARLQAAGFRLAALTNSPPAILRAQMRNGGLTDYFEQLLSVDAIGRFKPAAEVYHYAAAQLGVATRETCMVAAHDWDIAGAQHAGCRSAFVSRPGAVMGQLQQRPDIVGDDLLVVADKIIARDWGTA